MRSWSGQARPVEFAQTASINFAFDNKQTPLTTGMSLMTTCGFSGRLVLARLIAKYAATNLAPAGTATVEILWTTFNDYPFTTPMNGTDGRPGIILGFPYKTDIDITHWLQYVQLTDILQCSIVAITGSIISLTLALHFRKLAAPGFGVVQLVDHLDSGAGSNDIVDNSGDDVTTQE